MNAVAVVFGAALFVATVAFLVYETVVMLHRNGERWRR